MANKLPGVRAALCYDVSSARNSREHNDANVVTLGAMLIGPGLAQQIVDIFLDTQCTAERHLNRVAMISEIENAVRSGESGSAGLAELALSELSEADLQRVAQRIGHLMRGGGGATEGAHTCTEACGFCQSCAEMNPELLRQFIDLGADRIVQRGDGDAVPADVAHYIDHTLLRPDATFD